jgi:hypothetical protein
MSDDARPGTPRRLRASDLPIPNGIPIDAEKVGEFKLPKTEVHPRLA